MAYHNAYMTIHVEVLLVHGTYAVHKHACACMHCIYGNHIAMNTTDIFGNLYIYFPGCNTKLYIAILDLARI